MTRANRYQLGHVARIARSPTDIWRPLPNGCKMGPKNEFTYGVHIKQNYISDRIAAHSYSDDIVLLCAYEGTLKETRQQRKAL